VVFINRNCSAYLDRIDLVARSPQVIAELSGTEQVRDEAQPEILVDVRDLSSPEGSAQ
jgi:hypothetical protein